MPQPYTALQINERIQIQTLKRAARTISRELARNRHSAMGKGHPPPQSAPPLGLVRQH